MKKKLYFLIVFITTFQLCIGQEYNNTDYKSYEKAKEILYKVNTVDYDKIDTLNYSLSGTWYYAGHYELPELRKPIPTDNYISVSRNKYLKLESKSEFGKEIFEKSEYFSQDSSFISNVASKEGLRKESYLPFYSPVSVYWDILENKSSIRYIGSDKDPSCDIISYNSSFNKQVSVYINKSDATIKSVQFLKYNDIEGDHFLQYCYKDYSIQKGFNLPKTLLIKEWNTESQNFKYSYTFITKEKDIRDTYSFKQIAKNLYKITLPTEKHFSYIVDFGEYIGIIETPVNEMYCQKIAYVAQANLPGKPIKYIFLTHHHPDHAGGFPYFYNNGSLVITTELSSIYQKKLLNRKHSLNKSNINYNGSKGDFIIIPSLGEKDFSTKNTKMKAYEFGKNGHTEEFLLYYFPESKILIVGDLFYSQPEKIRASNRAEKIAHFIKTHKLKVEKLYQTWSPSGFKEFSTMEDLEASQEMYNNMKTNKL